jgi:hypothetical protein
MTETRCIPRKQSGAKPARKGSGWQSLPQLRQGLGNLNRHAPALLEHASIRLMLRTLCLVRKCGFPYLPRSADTRYHGRHEPA